mgnify:CR=1 FL=1
MAFVCQLRWKKPVYTNKLPSVRYVTSDLAREANVMTTDRRFCALLRDCLDGIFRTAGTPLDLQVLNARHWSQRVLDRIAFGIMRVVLFVTGHRY